MFPCLLQSALLIPWRWKDNFNKDCSEEKKTPTSPWLFYHRVYWSVASCPSSKNISNIEHISKPEIKICIHFQLLRKITRENCQGIHLTGQETPVWEDSTAPLTCPWAANSLLCQGSSTDTCGPWKTNPVPLPVGFIPPKACLALGRYYWLLKFVNTYRVIKLLLDPSLVWGIRFPPSLWEAFKLVLPWACWKAC